MVSHVDQKQCQSGTKIVPFWKKRNCFEPFLFFLNSATLAWGAVLFLKMIIKDKNTSPFQKGTIFHVFFWLGIYHATVCTKRKYAIRICLNNRNCGAAE